MFMLILRNIINSYYAYVIARVIITYSKYPSTLSLSLSLSLIQIYSYKYM